MKKFYYVHNRKMGNPTFRHFNKEEAVEEAKRLALSNNKNFYILESVAKVNYNGELYTTIELNETDDNYDDLNLIYQKLESGNFTEYDLKDWVNRNIISDINLQQILNEKNKYKEFLQNIVNISKERISKQ